MSKRTKAQLLDELAEARDEIEELKNKLYDEELNGEAIMECRALFDDLGHSAAFFDDVVRSACTEIKALRYDVDRYRRRLESAVKFDVRLSASPMKNAAKRPKEFAEYIALAG